MVDLSAFILQNDAIADRDSMFVVGRHGSQSTRIERILETYESPLQASPPSDPSLAADASQDPMAQQRADALTQAILARSYDGQGFDELQFDQRLERAAVQDGSLIRIYQFDGVQAWREVGRVEVDGYWTDFFLFTIYSGDGDDWLAVGMNPPTQVHFPFGAVCAVFESGFGMRVVPTTYAEARSQGCGEMGQYEKNEDGDMVRVEASELCCYPVLQQVPLSELVGEPTWSDTVAVSPE